jgi:hypothetical protein
MTNAITLRVNEIPNLLDLVYKKASVTAILEKPSSIVRETEMAGTIKIAKRALTGYGDYDRSTGYPSGSVTQTWESHDISYDRGIKFQVDRLDNDESGKNAFKDMASLGGQFMREKATPEIDAVRFSVMAGTSGINTTTAADLSTTTVKTAVDDAIAALDEDEVPEENRVIFMATGVYNLMKNSGFFTYNLNASTGGNLDGRFAEYDGMPVIKVPQSRFYTAVDLYDAVTTGETAGGYAKSGSGVNINFMIVHQDAAIPVRTLDKMKYFSPDVNQTADAHLLQSRLYHDLFVPEQKVEGIYLHKATA